MLLREDFHFKPGASGIVGTFQNGVDPGHRFTLRSSMNLGRAVNFDLEFRALGRLHHADVPAYAELAGRVAWNVSDRVALTLTGANLLHAHHVEYPGGDAMPRKVLLGVQWQPASATASGLDIQLFRGLVDGAGRRLPRPSRARAARPRARSRQLINA